MSSELDKVVVWTAATYRQPMTLQQYQAQTRALLVALQSTLPELRDFWVVGPNQVFALAANLADIEDVIAAAVYDDAHLSDYVQLTDAGKLNPTSLSKIGFSVTYGLAKSYSPLSLEEGGAYLALQGTTAGLEPTTSSVLEFLGQPATVAWTEKRRHLLRLLLTMWPSSFGGVSIPSFQQSVRGNDRASYAGQWLFYLPFPHLAKCLPPDIHHEPFANGILIETTPHMPDANNPADVAAGKRVRDVLDEFGLVNDATYAIEGWPPDQEETIYEHFISGAPADRKYTVHCINFDGYDPDRKVLLYAKLFRRLKRHPKEWGLRGWDGPVLNEAKRQVRAAAKAGGVPIEWHIGLEEPAHQVRQLLADYTTITEQQLRVIYTPLQEALSRPPR